MSDPQPPWRQKAQRLLIQEGVVGSPSQLLTVAILDALEPLLATLAASAEPKTCATCKHLRISEVEKADEAGGFCSFCDNVASVVTCGKWIPTSMMTTFGCTLHEPSPPDEPANHENGTKQPENSSKKL